MKNQRRTTTTTTNKNEMNPLSFNFIHITITEGVVVITAEDRGNYFTMIDFQVNFQQMDTHICVRTPILFDKY